MSNGAVIAAAALCLLAPSSRAFRTPTPSICISRNGASVAKTRTPSSICISSNGASIAKTRTPSICISRNGLSVAKRTTGPRASTRLPMAFDVSDATAEPKQGTEQIIDSILDECTRYSARRPIMVQFDPQAKAIWRHWRGTVLSETWRSAVKHALWAAAAFVALQKYPRASSWLRGFDTIWGELLAVTTFTLTFFVNEAYSCWRKCLDVAYNVQGSLNNFSMALAGCSRRTETADGVTTSTFTEPARKVLLIVARYIRLFNILSYASFTRSHRPLLTPQGMRQMVKRGLMTEKERDVLVNSRVSTTGRSNVVLMWVLRVAIEAKKAGYFDGGEGFEANILERIEEVRAQANYMECILRGRMHFGYAHLVQVLVDSVVWLYPVMAFTSGLSLQIGMLGAVALTFTYQGLFDLAKRFLDPFNNESFWSGHDPIRVDTLIAETNSGSRRWMFGLEDMPVPLNSITTGAGDLDSFILPDEGISVADLESVEESTSNLEPEVGEDDLDEEEEEQLFQEEFEETQAILSAPPGADFVPGVDDVDEIEDCTPDDETECEEPELYTEDEGPPNKVFDQYLATYTEEYEESLRNYEEGDHFQ
ncbi:hypothetical protein ACHAXT_006665 [Thalassiosira profunda]